MKDWINLLKNNNIAFKENELLSKHTSWEIGGPAEVFIQPINKEELILTLKILNAFKVKWKVLGNGSNVLVSDQGYQGAIISLSEGLKQYSVENTLIVADAGVSLIYLANLAGKHGLSGLEFAAGIPGTIGGAIYMNAGAHGSDIAKILDEAEVILENGEIRVWKAIDFNFEYRTSTLQKVNAIVVNAKFNLQKGDSDKIIADMRSYKERRIKTQPYNMACTGSVFRNPSNDYAGRLIEELGLKGYQIGDAQVSPVHANFIVNVGNAKSEDVLSLIKYIKEKVYERYNIDLIPEVELVN